MRLRPRYFVALLWHWSIPFCIGVVTAYLCATVQLSVTLPEVEQMFTRSVQAACNPGQQAPINPL